MNVIDIAMLAFVMWKEASGEGEAGMEAVGNVVWNRAKKYKTSIYVQCVAPNQFSSITVRGDQGTVRWPHETDPVWVQAQQISQNFANIGQISDPTKGALYYENPKIATSGWFFNNIVNKPDQHPKLVTLGNHVFYA